MCASASLLVMEHSMIIQEEIVHLESLKLSVGINLFRKIAIWRYTSPYIPSIHLKSTSRENPGDLVNMYMRYFFMYNDTHL